MSINNATSLHRYDGVSERSNLIYALANTKPSISPSAGKDWLDANEKMIWDAVYSSEHWDEKSECIWFIRQIFAQRVGSIHFARAEQLYLSFRRSASSSIPSCT
jgi:hypothetical protein